MESTSTNSGTSDPTNKKRRWALYARVSTALQGSGLDSQIRALRIFCEQNNVTDYELFADETQAAPNLQDPHLIA